VHHRRVVGDLSGKKFAENPDFATFARLVERRCFVPGTGAPDSSAIYLLSGFRIDTGFFALLKLCDSCLVARFA
jgi:hypothetical protein